MEGNERPGGTTAPPDMAVPEEMLRDGHALQRSQTRYTTAVAVQKPRNLDLIVKALEKEAEYAGKDWFYHWVVESTDHSTGEVKTEIVQGGSINMAYAMAREMGNCAVECDDVRMIGNATYFFPCFVDLEKGTTVQRPFRASNLGEVHGRYKAARKADMLFQIAVSKASRNVIFAGTYKWMEKRLVRKAQEVAAKQITAEGLEHHTKRALKAFGELGVSEEMLVERVGSPVAKWAVEDIVMLSGFMTAINDAETTVADLFPRVSKERTGTGEVDPEAAMTPEKVEDPKDAPADGGPKAHEPAEEAEEEAEDVPDAPEPGPAGDGDDGKGGQTDPENPLFPKKK